MKSLRKSVSFWGVRQTSTYLKIKTAQIMAARTDYALRESVFKNIWFESDMIRIDREKGRNHKTSEPYQD